MPATNVSQFARHGNTTFILCPARLRAQGTSWATMCPPRSFSRRRSRALEENNSLQKITVCGQTNFLRFCSHKVVNRSNKFNYTRTNYRLKFQSQIFWIHYGLFFGSPRCTEKINWANKDAVVVIAKEAPINSAYSEKQQYTRGEKEMKKPRGGQGRQVFVKKAQRKWAKCIQ